MKPQPAIHGPYHPLAAQCELTVGVVLEQAVTIDRSIAYAYLPSAQAAPGTSAQVQVFGRWVPATVAREPLYDPAGERIRS